MRPPVETLGCVVDARPQLTQLTPMAGEPEPCAQERDILRRLASLHAVDPSKCALKNNGAKCCLLEP